MPRKKYIGKTVKWINSQCTTERVPTNRLLERYRRETRKFTSESKREPRNGEYLGAWEKYFYLTKFSVKYRKQFKAKCCNTD